MFRSLLIIVTVLSACLNSVHAAEESRSLRKAYVAQMQLAMALRAMNELPPGKSLSRLPELSFDESEVRDPQLLQTVAALRKLVLSSHRKRLSGESLPAQLRIVEAFPSFWNAAPSSSSEESCREALDHELTKPLRISLVDNGVIWIRVSAPTPGVWAFDTLISDFDTRLSVYRDCREIGKAAQAVSDDALGLGSLVGFRASTPGETRVIKLERLGGIGHLVVAKGGAAAGVSGIVTRETDASPLNGVTIYLESPNGNNGTAITQSGGQFTTYFYEGGNYSLRTSFEMANTPHLEELVPEAYPDGKCINDIRWDLDACSGDIQFVALTEGTVVSGINFQLDSGAVISGRLTSAPTDAPIVQGRVELLLAGDEDRMLVGRTAYSDSNGRFRIAALAPAEWKVEFGDRTHVSKRWENSICGSPVQPQPCIEGSGTTVATAGKATILLDTQLPRSNAFKVRFTTEGQETYGGVDVYSADGVLQQSFGIEGSPYRVIGPFAAGQYRLVGWGDNVVSRVVGGPECFSSECAKLVLNGTLFNLPEAAPQTIVIEMRPFARLEGALQEDNSGAPIASAVVEVYPVGSGYPISSTSTGPDGAFVSAPVAPGRYLIHAISRSHVDEMFPDVACESSNLFVPCAGSGEVDVQIGDAPPSIQMQLSRSGRMTGTTLVSQAADANPIVVAPMIRRIRPNGSVISETQTQMDAHGVYQYTDVPPGAHRFAAEVYYFRHQLFPGIDCPYVSFVFPQPYESCQPQAAMPITWLGSETQGAVNFFLTPWSSRRVRVRDADTLQPISGVAIDQWSPSGQWRASKVTDSQGRAIVWKQPAPSDPNSNIVLISTDNTLGYIDIVYDGRTCPPGTSAYRGTCSLAAAWLVQIAGENDAPYAQIEILLRSADPLFKSDFE